MNGDKLKELLSLPNLVKLAGLLIAIAGSAFTIYGKMSVAQAQLADHGTRLEKIESDLAAKSIRDAKNDQKIDDLIGTVGEIRDNVRDLHSRHR